MYARACTHAHTYTQCFTQETYNDAFFEALDGVTNALDNVDASESVIVSYSYVHHRMLFTVGYCARV